MDNLHFIIHGGVKTAAIQMEFDCESIERFLPLWRLFLLLFFGGGGRRGLTMPLKDYFPCALVTLVSVCVRACTCVCSINRP